MKKRASMTVEAAFVLPVFLFAMILLSYLGQLIRCQDEMQWALNRMAREASSEYGMKPSEVQKSKAYYLSKLNLYLKGTGIGVTFFDSHILEENDEIDLIASYQVHLPFSLLPIEKYEFRQRVHTRAFTGVENRGEGMDEGDVVVYVTETGRVYHRSLDCTYLKLSISQVKYGDLASLRNEGGGKYKSCEKCCKNRNFTGGSTIWITNFGDRYHSNRACSGITRNIRSVSLAEVGNRTPCSKCGEE